MFYPDFSAWLHLETLRFQAWPIVTYLSDARTQEGMVLPALISIALSIAYLRRIKDPDVILGFLLFAMTIGISTAYWGVTGLHTFTANIILWPVLVFLLGDRLPWPMVYPLAFLGTLVPDLYGAGMSTHWTNAWFFGVGGAGWQDGLFWVPLKTLMAAALLHHFGNTLRQHGYFHRRTPLSEDVCFTGIENHRRTKGEQP
ncbi:hypothetical protein ACJU26_08620 [Acidithiobacillus sp. M4-SHS-6]|uniref:hypothetical protein n=1 Tax=Acidithiobacillus sp. M4-SHS-6 TaxID=3383024 RepID=UPI0039BE1ADF